MQNQKTEDYYLKLRLGESIKKIRLMNKLTQRQLAEIINKHYATVYAYETGTIEPPLIVLLTISTVFQADIDAILNASSII